jgi:hypothetical protein
MNTPPRTLFAGGALVSLLLMAQSVEAAQRFVPGEIDLSGELGGAPFRIRVPERWNGILLVYAHGFRDKADHPGQVNVRRVDIVPVNTGGDVIPPDVDVAAREGLFLSQGFALAGSAYRSNGFAVKEGVEDLKSGHIHKAASRSSFA